MLTTSNFISICHHIIDPLYLFCPPQPHYPFPSGNHYSVPCSYFFVWFALFIYFDYCFLSHVWVKSYDIYLPPSDSFHLAWYPLGSPTLSQMARFLFMAMTNLDSILKSRDITLPTKVHLVKAMVFPVVMYGYVRVELWRKLSAKELMLLNCGVGEDSWESHGLPGDPTSPF